MIVAGQRFPLPRWIGKAVLDGLEWYPNHYARVLPSALWRQRVDIPQSS